MLVDFHSHFASSDSIVCTDTPDAENRAEALLNCLGLLPDKWAKSLEGKLMSSLSEDPSLHLGEVGLDRRFASIMPAEVQIEALKRELGHAISLGRCISLHCVRETGNMVKLLSELHFRPFSVLWHGFTGSSETAAELYRMGVIVSIGPSFHGDAKSLIKANPMLALETDYTKADGAEHARILDSHYNATAEALGISISELQSHCSEVLKAFLDR